MKLIQTIYKNFSESCMTLLILVCHVSTVENVLEFQIFHTRHSNNMKIHGNLSNSDKEVHRE